MSIAAAENDLGPSAASSSWRTWLLTGTRRRPIYRRRVRGAHKGLKRMLVEGMTNGVEGQNTWNSFSGAMVRQAVGDGVSSLPPRQKQLIKLAYFSELSNREIAQCLGITLSSVERGLRQAIARVSEHVERGRTAGRRVICALAMFLGGRWLGDAQRAVKLGTVIIVTASAGAVLSAQPAAPAQVTHVHRGGVPPATSSQLYEPARIPAVEVEHALPAAPNVSTSVAPPVVAVPVTLAVPVEAPPLPATPIVHGLLGA
jgi:DNA-directed RNA polymerase specialized sigma24 family protein